MGEFNEFQSNNIEVNGLLIKKDKSIYKGKLVNSKKTGDGILLYADKSVYLGNFKNNKR